MIFSTSSAFSGNSRSVKHNKANTQLAKRIDVDSGDTIKIREIKVREKIITRNLTECQKIDEHIAGAQYGDSITKLRQKLIVQMDQMTDKFV